MTTVQSSSRRRVSGPPGAHHGLDGVGLARRQLAALARACPSSGRRAPRASPCRCRGPCTPARPRTRPASATRLHGGADVATGGRPARMAAIPAASDGLGDLDEARPPRGRSLPTPVVKAASPCQPSTIAPQSIETMSPSSRRYGAGDAVHDHVVRRGADHPGERRVAVARGSWSGPRAARSRPARSGRGRRWSTPGRMASRMHVVHLRHDPPRLAHLGHVVLRPPHEEETRTIPSEGRPGRIDDLEDGRPVKKSSYTDGLGEGAEGHPIHRKAVHGVDDEVPDAVAIKRQVPERVGGGSLERRPR